MIALLLYAIPLFIITSFAILLPEILFGLLGNGIHLVEVIFHGVKLEHGITFTLTLGSVIFCVWYSRKYKLNIMVADNRKILSVILGFGALLWLGLIYTPSPLYGYNKALFYLLRNVIPFIGFLIISHDTVKLKRLLGIFAIIGIVFLIASAPSIARGDYLSASRFSVLNRNPIWYARILGVSIVSLLFFYKGSSTIILKPFILVTMMLLIVPMVFSGSRGPIFSLILAIFTFAVLSSKKVRLTKNVIQWALIVGGVYLVYHLVSYLAGAYWTRFTDIEKINSFVFEQVRLKWWAISLQGFIDSPLLGWGTGGYTRLLGVGDIPAYPHNVLLEVACESGIVGLVLFSSFLILTIKNIVILRKEEGSSPVYRLAVPFASLFIFAISNAMFSGDLYSNEMIWYSSGVLTGLVTSRKFSIHKLADEKTVSTHILTRRYI